MTKRYVVRYKNERWEFDDPFAFVEKVFEVFRKEREERRKIEVEVVRGRV